ncbi:glucokinase [Evansella vedderi]|uniref:Glucokinase n=1 Tax=Evansella vedderi TaxID=38282 RepID=A0ABT9ZT54_9BACI|nr:ROK family glucokinase [Evansella vedderi]MDQ0254421.1 glucokinase [Evansella vedderi]
MGKWLAGIDIGGTTVKLSIINELGNIKTKWEIPTNVTESGKYIVTDIARSLLEKLEELGIEKADIRGVGIGAPGFIDVERGLIFEAVNLGWKDFPLKEEMEKELQLPTFVDNDANIAAIGEMWKGAGEGSVNLLCVTLGTGVGGGIIAGGEVIHGESGMAGEIGHITSVIEGGAPCNCGKKGCLETVASATGISRLGLEAIKKNPTGILQSIYEKNGSLSSKDVFDAFKENDPLAEEVVNESFKHLGFALANLANAINPKTIVIGGGVSKAGDVLVNKIIGFFKEYAIPKIAQETTIRLATLGNDAGVYGAAWLAKERTK